MYKRYDAFWIDQTCFQNGCYKKLKVGILRVEPCVTVFLPFFWSHDEKTLYWADPGLLLITPTGTRSLRPLPTWQEEEQEELKWENSWLRQRIINKIKRRETNYVIAHHLAKQTNSQPAGAEDTLPLFFLYSQFLLLNMALYGREYTSG